MLNKKNCIVAFLALPFIGFSQQPTDSITIQKKLDEVNVSALRANEKTPVTFTNLNKSEI
jgi:iron complex outermembrane receptor protein